MRSATMLSQIVEHKRQEVAERQASVPLAEVRAEAFDSPPPRDFTTAVTRRRRETETREPLRRLPRLNAPRRPRESFASRLT